METFDALPDHFGNSGPCKQKAYADKWHEDGLHQVMVFCGMARSSLSSSIPRFQQAGKGTDTSNGTRSIYVEKAKETTKVIA